MGKLITVIHLGAGHHAPKNNKQYRALLKEALCRDDPIASIRDVEGSQLTNTGYGSSLDLEGNVKCDATVIVKRKHIIETGSMYNIAHRYPICETVEMMDLLGDLYGDANNPYFLSKPLCLDYASRRSIRELASNIKGVCTPRDDEADSLVSQRSREIFKRYKNQIFGTRSVGQKEVENVKVEGSLTDTIGLLFTDDITTSIYTSSGGNFFKLPGRIGCAGIPGSATELVQNEDVEVCCMCSGNGEDIISMKLASTVALQVLSEPDIDSIGLVGLIKEKASNYNLFARDENGSGIVYIGMVILVKEKALKRQRLVYCHSTESFYFGYKADGGASKVVLSRQDDESKFGNTFVAGEFKLE